MSKPAFDERGLAFVDDMLQKAILSLMLRIESAKASDLLEKGEIISETEKQITILESVVGWTNRQLSNETTEGTKEKSNA